MSNRRHSTWRKITDDEVVMKAMKNIRAKYLSNQLDIQLIAQDTHLAGSTLRGHFLYPERCTVRSYLMFQKLLGLPEYVPNRKLSPADAQPTRRVSTQGETPITDRQTHITFEGTTGSQNTQAPRTAPDRQGHITFEGTAGSQDTQSGTPAADKQKPLTFEGTAARPSTQGETPITDRQKQITFEDIAAEEDIITKYVPPRWADPRRAWVRILPYETQSALKTVQDISHFSYETMLRKALRLFLTDYSLSHRLDEASNAQGNTPICL